MAPPPYYFPPDTTRRLCSLLSKNPGEFTADVHLVFSNARVYNSDLDSLVHKASQELFELFESKFAALESNLDEAFPKRGTSSSGTGGGSSGGSVNSSVTACADDAEHSSTKSNQRKRKGSIGGKACGKGGHGTENRRSKNARAMPSTKGVPSPQAFSEGIERFSPTDP